MTRRKLTESDLIASANKDLSNWPTVNPNALTNEAKELFLRRKTAVDMYMQNEASMQQIETETGINRTWIWRLVKRCLSEDDHGKIWGYRALIPQRNIKSYKRLVPTDKSSLVGAFDQLLRRFPSIKQKIDNLYLKRSKNTVSDNVMSMKYIHRSFVDACRQAGLTIQDYPFTTKTLAQRSLYRYVKELEQLHQTEAAKRNGEQASRLIRSTGIGEQNVPMIVRPFERVQFDGHKIDAIFSITIQTPEGDEITEVMDRIWLLVIIDVATRVILGYHITFNMEYTATDVLQCIKNAVVPWTPKKITIPGLRYSEWGGFASNVVPETQWGVWDEFLYDNAKANLATVVRERLTQIIQCGINAGPVSTPERRGIIERFFLTLEENGYHRLPSTTGSHPNDPRRQDPEKKAIKYKISAKHLEELTEVLIANYNGTPHDGVNNLTPLEALKQRIEVRGMTVRQLSPTRRNEMAFLSLETQREIKGNIRAGKRPYIQFENVIYRSEVLSRTPDLIGIKLTLFVNTQDLRVIKAFLPDGSEFGFLTATGKWGVSPHTLQDRKSIFRLRNRKMIHFTSTDDPIQVYQTYLQSQASATKKDRNKLAEFQRKQASAEKQVPPDPAQQILMDEQKTLIKRADNQPLTIEQPRLRRTITY
ncbi:hypothetical protein [Brevibacillus brevis]|uniref:hypothetical protein n=1 Tax=Brevibacillus brevis TaxID=1393 RepID=UPI0025A56109|nr:hypothetical protein [Brevibacillus brevis]WJQ78966.1 hypothetical protein QN310_15745 [Brevibacillus brevis]